MGLRTFEKVLVANRGEIAVRIMRCLREMGIRSVAVHSVADRSALHVSEADEAHEIGPPAPRDSYLRIDRLIEVARASGAEAIHPGYGFLSENAEFARACERAGLVFIGPRPQTLELLGNKVTARELAAGSGVPTVPGTLQPLSGPDEARSRAAEIGYPVLLKAAAGGGGKGMRTVTDPAGLVEAYERAASEARNAFGDPTLYMEKRVVEPHHVEVQVLADGYGNVIHLGERECSIQRRHQKLVEESPSPTVDSELRDRLGACAVRLARSAGYVGAGTVEFLVDGAGSFYFLEVNTRLQVEHPVTELVTGIDLVREQIEIARGKALSFTQDDIRPRGSAMECRIYAEDPATGFMPCPGTITVLDRRSVPGVREDTSVMAGSVVPPDYDPLVSKVIAWAPDRDRVIERLIHYFRSYTILGIETTAPFFRRLLDHPGFRAGRVTTGFLDAHPELLAPDPGEDTVLDALLAGTVLAALEAQRRRPGQGTLNRNWRDFGRRQAMSSAFRYRD